MTMTRYPLHNSKLAALWYGWFPTRIRLAAEGTIVDWIHAPDTEFDEPTFKQAVDSILAAKLRATRNRTDAKTMNDVAFLRGAATPAGLIFHTSRCGSTLVCNGIRHLAHARVLAEPQPIHALLTPFDSEIHMGTEREWACQRADWLHSLVGVYANFREPLLPLVIKCISWDTFSIRFLRMLWPNVPTVFVYREPSAVIVSQLARPSLWLRSRRFPSIVHRYTGIPAERLMVDSLEEYYSIVIGGIADNAILGAGQDALFVNYDDIRPEMIVKIAQHFNLPIKNSVVENLFSVFSSYSKDASHSAAFHSDRELKKKLATPKVMASVEKWSSRQFSELNLDIRRATV